MTDFDYISEDQAPSLSGATAQAMLPMVVWLRGDEPLCEEFVLDADQVMEQLGIRRSRLTQISGKELRVGRTRKGRYVSPVYRQIDVDAYRAWTRPTASHLKSSTVLQDAAASLTKQKDELSEQFETGLDAAIEAMDRSLRQSALDIMNYGESESRRLTAELRATEDSVHHKIDMVQARVETLRTLFTACQTQLETLTALHSMLAKDVAETGALVRIERDDARSRAELVSEQLATVTDSVAQLADEMIALKTNIVRVNAARLKPVRSAALVARRAARLERQTPMTDRKTLPSKKARHAARRRP